MWSYICCITDDKYFDGLLVVRECLIKSKSTIPFNVLIPKDSGHLRDRLVKNKISFIECDSIKSKHSTNHYFDNTFFKLNAFSLVQFDKIVLLDSDLLILNNIDDLFKKPHLSAAVAGKIQNPEWNEMCSGLLVIEPNMNLFNKLILSIDDSRDYMIKRENRKIIGDQDVIIYNHPDWPNKQELHLEETYDEFFYCVETLSKSLPQGFNGIKVIHFNGPNKPWTIKKKDYFYMLLYYLKHKEFAFLKGYRSYRKMLALVKRKYE